MLETYEDSDAGTNRVSFTKYTCLGEANLLGWDVELAEREGKPFILFRALAWKGRQPRFILTATDTHFAKCLRDLTKFSVRRCHLEVTLVEDKRIWVTGGLSSIPDHHDEKKQLWKQLARGK